MKIKISSNILLNFPNIHYTVILVKNANNLRKTSSLSQLLRGVSVVAKNELKKIEKKDLFTQITERELEDGSNFLEGYLLGSKMKKVQNGKDIEGKNNLINLINLLSLKYYLPLHGFDLDQAEQDYILDLYLPKKGKKSPELDFSPQTRHFAVWFPNLANLPEEEIDKYIAEINVNVSKYLNTQISEVYHLDANHPEIDLGYQSEKEQEFNSRQQEENLPLPEVKMERISEYSPVTTKEPSASEIIKDWIIDLSPQLFPEANLEFTQLIEVEVPKDSSHGDLSTNLAMKLTKSLGQAPQQIAQKILEGLQQKITENPGLVERVETVGPGFINFHLSQVYFQNKLQQILKDKELFGKQNIGQGKKIMIEFGSLNIAKPFGAHHFLTTVIGQTLVNLYRTIGFNVLAGDFPGDWGTQFGKAIFAYKQWGNKEIIEKDPLNELLKLYVKFHNEAENNPGLEDQARGEFKKLEEGDQENLQLWKWMVEVSTRDLETIYQTMGVKHDRHYPESKYNQSSQELLEKGKRLGVVTEGEKGAFVVNLDDQNLPTAIIQKADGTTLYITRDLASIEDRLASEPDLKRLVYVVDMAQSLHFKQLFAIAQKLHQADPAYPTCEFKHVPYGRMSFADGGMSTRKGNIIQGRDLIKEALVRAENIVKEKLSGSGEKFTPAEHQQLVHGLAISAIKYAMLSQAPESDFIFDWDKVLSFEGNSAPYLQYSLARASSILRKGQLELAQNSDKNKVKTPGAPEDQISLFSLEEEKKATEKAAEIAAAESTQTPFGLPIERELLKLLSAFPDRVSAAALNYKPNTLTNYLHELAQTFNSFYGSVPVLGSQRADLREARMQLVQATIQILKNGLQILGMAVFERM